MSTFWRRFLLILGLFALGGGCNPLMFPFLYEDDATVPPEIQTLATKDRKKIATVVILTSISPQTQVDFLRADREIASSLAFEMQKRVKETGKYLTIVHPSKVEEYKSAHPDWENSEVEAIGKHFKADYVISVEINQLNLSEPSGHDNFYHAHASINVKLVNVKDPDQIALGSRQIVFNFPTGSEGVEQQYVDGDTPPSLFRQNFLTALVRRLSWCFVDRPTHHGGMNPE
jgi:hypothetical protein